VVKERTIAHVDLIQTHRQLSKILQRILEIATLILTTDYNKTSITKAPTITTRTTTMAADRWSESGGMRDKFDPNSQPNVTACL
jgi:hypothetical protein